METRDRICMVEEEEDMLDLVPGARCICGEPALLCGPPAAEHQGAGRDARRLQKDAARDALRAAHRSCSSRASSAARWIARRIRV